MIYIIASNLRNAQQIEKKSLINPGAHERITLLTTDRPERLRGMSFRPIDIVLADDEDLMANAEEEFWANLSYAMRDRPTIIEVSL